MKKKMRSLLVLALAMILVLSLCACGEKTQEGPEKNDKPEETPEMVYTYESKTLDSKLIKDGIYPLVFSEQGFYGQTYEQVEPVTTTADQGEDEQEGETRSDEEAPESETEDVEIDRSDNYVQKLYFVGYDGSVRPLSAYTMQESPENTDNKLEYYSGATINSLLIDKDGGLIAIESTYEGWFDGTEAELHRDTPDTWEKYKSSQDYYLCRLNEDGSEKSCVKLDYQAQDSWLNLSACQFTDDGLLLVASGEGIFGFAEDGSLALQINSSDISPDQLLKLRDGSFAVMGYTDKGLAFFPIDLEKKTLGQPMEIPSEAYEPLPGDEKYDLYYVNGMYLYGYRIEDQQKDKVLNWLDVDINGSNLSRIHFLEDGSLMCVLNQYRSEQVTTELVRVFQAPYDSVPHKETLTLAVMYGYELYDKVVDFNRHSDKVRIEIVDYSEFNDPENDDFDAGRTKLLTEIMSGQVPDLIAVSQLPYRQLASKGLLEDLYPYIDADKELSREDYFPNVLKALEVNGGLYQVITGFNVQTLIGASSVVGDKPGWTYQDMKDALAKMPAGCEPMDMYTTRGDLLRILLCTDLDHYVDWSSGQCSFESQDFLDLLEFTAQFPAEIPDDLEWESSSTRIAEGRQMLTTAYLYSVDSMIWNDVQFGETGCTYIGYPTNNGVGSYMYLSSGYAMSANCRDKEAGWEFLRSFITYENQKNSWDGIPLSTKVYQEKLEEAMTPQYEMNEKGECVLDERGDKIPQPVGSIWMENGGELEIYSMTQEQADKLWEAVTTCDKVWEEDEAIYSIVFEQAQAYYSGQKSAEEVARLIQSKVTIYVNEQR